MHSVKSFYKVNKTKCAWYNTTSNDPHELQGDPYDFHEDPRRKSPRKAARQYTVKDVHYQLGLASPSPSIDVEDPTYQEIDLDSNDSELSPHHSDDEGLHTSTPVNAVDDIGNTLNSSDTGTHVYKL